jgi:hypothetical protein
MKWIAICNGGPNDTIVGKECSSLGKACGTLESMMNALNATTGQVYQRTIGQETLDQDRFVSKEEDAGKAIA